MAVSVNESNALREWAPLTDLFSRLPSRIQNGIFNQEVKLTCVDVLPEYIALGTNLGIVYWYNRKKKDLQRLRCENVNSSITVVKVISTVDYMLACGNNDGNISIFQIPKSHPDNLPEILKPKNKQVERYSVSDMHKGAICAIEWSRNGMKLFSGDKNGLVVLTEIDFYMHICKSVEILNEAYEVVQLSYYQQNLLISTTYRSIVCQRQDKWKVSQVGKKDRKVLGKFGAMFYPNGLRPNDIILYCTRPGLRIWVSDITGCVQQTLLFKDILNKQCPEVPLINPISNNLKKLKPAKEACFGILLTFQDFLVTYGSDVVYLLNPKDLTVISTVSNLRGILGVATNKDEIFILEEERTLIRLACHPETFNEENYPIPTASTFMPLSSSIIELTNKIHTSSIISAIPPLIGSQPNNFSIHTDVTSVINAEEAIESPVRCPTRWRTESSEIKLVDDDTIDRSKRIEIFNKIAEEEFDDTILFKHHRRKKHSNMTTSVSSLSSNSSDEHDTTVSKPTLMNISTVNGLPDLRSPDSILSDIEQKEKMLADILNFDKVKINLCDLKECENEITQVAKIDNTIKKEDYENSDAIKQYTNFILEDAKQSKSVNTTEVLNLKQNGLLQPVSSGVPSKLQIHSFQSTETPAIKSIPNDWQLLQVQLNTSRDKSESDNSLGDWELI